MHYCAYQERCHAEVRKKLYDFGLRTPDVEDIITRLISENFLNEERFAVHFARGKFRMKKWGKEKIRRELSARQVSNYCIAKAIQQIDDAEYDEVFKRLADKKWLSLSGEKNIFIKRKKTSDYLIAKGYSFEMVNSYRSDR